MSIVLRDKMVESSPLTAVRTRTPWARKWREATTRLPVKRSNEDFLAGPQSDML